MVDATTLCQLSEWNAPSGISINCASGNHTQVGSVTRNVYRIMSKLEQGLQNKLPELVAEMTC